MQRWISAYKTAAIILFNALLLFTAANFAACVWLSNHKEPPRGNAVTAKYDLERLAKVYPGFSKEQIVQLLDETWTEPVQYAPFVQFQERPCNGTFVRVSPHGFRLGKEPAPWPPDPAKANVFVFGGSTTFGYGLPDAQTVPAFLQEHLRGKTGRDWVVYNFGRGYYYSTQERILFEQLLAGGFIPRMALFIDGLNEFFHPKDEPNYTRVLARLMDKASRESQPASPHQPLEALPLVQLVQRLGRRPDHAPSSPTPPSSMADFDPRRFDAPAFFEFVIRRWTANRELIEAAAARFGVRTAFIWQPVPVYKYDLASHLFTDGGFGAHAFAHFGYAAVEKFFREHPSNNLLWCANLQENWKAPLYVDRIHYNALLSERFAETIADELARRKILP